MNKQKWIEHINTWKKFLLTCLSETDDVGEKTRIERQIRTIERARCGAVLSPELLSEFINPSSPADYTPIVDTPYLNLNVSQLEAVKMALGDSPLSLIKGPPGTGKTQVIAEICLQLIKVNPEIRILICSETHVAVNNLIARISDINNQIRIVRIRDKENDALVDEHSPETIISSMLKWAKTNSYAEDAYGIIESELSDANDKSLEKALALSANIVGITCNRLSSYDFRDSTEMFDVAIIDEVCKATLPEILAPLLVSRKAVLLGDPNQLPPVFCSEELDVIRRIDQCDLNKFMYIDELMKTSERVVTLDTQYRMCCEIASMISSVFYDGLLINGRDSSNSDSLKWITYSPTNPWPIYSEDSDRPQVFNEDECRIIKELVDEINSKGKSDSIAVISPYRAQIRYLKKHLGSVDNVMIDTVDGFQGKEVNTVIFSLTRTHGSYRFLADSRRLNVALSRARNNIIIVGEADYSHSNPLLNTIMDYFTISNM